MKLNEFAFSKCAIKTLRLYVFAYDHLFVSLAVSVR